jgi:hypothetical protein
MSAPKVNLVMGDRTLHNLLYGPPTLWGDLATMDQAALQKLGIVGARERAAMNAAERNWYSEQERRFREKNGSEHRASSGWTSEMEKEEMRLPRKARTIRREHYRRKGELETKKVAERRARYAAEGLDSSEAEKVENARTTRKIKERARRKAAKKTLRRLLGRKK